MNPDTKLTAGHLQKICSYHRIPYESHIRITDGFTHELHRLNDNLVIKLHNPQDSDDIKRFRSEVALLGSNLPFLKPRLIASSEACDIVDRRYVIMSYIPGNRLGGVWHKANEDQRERLIKDISQTLRVINQADPEKLGMKSHKTWYEIIDNRASDKIVELRTRGCLPEVTIQKVEQTFTSSMPAFMDSRLYPVYWDIHFDNFLVDDAFKLQAIIDLETVELAPLDYPLFVIQKLTNTPERYLSEDNEKYALKKDYANLKNYYKKYYPEMFDTHDLEARVKIYELFDALHLVIHWPNTKENHDKIEELIAW